MMSDEQIISVDEFRKFAGKDAERFSDTQIKDLIIQLDLVAELFIEEQRCNMEDKATSVQAKS